MSAKVIVENDTGRPLHESGCISPFAVALGNDRYAPTIAWATCLQPFTFPVGQSIWRVTVVASYLECGPGRHLVHCRNGHPPPLPPGNYRAMLFQSSHIVPNPPPIRVRVTP